MQRLARVASLWNWLPGFRAVAETENLHEAARALDVSPSSLSRTIRLLEGELDRPLFERSSTGMRLTPLGRELLEVTRAAMRRIDDVLGPGRELLSIAAAAGVASAVVVPVLARLHGEIPARVLSDPDHDPLGRLLRGELDLVVGHAELVDRHVLVDRVGELRIRLYVAADHPLAGGPASLDDALGWPFVRHRGAEPWSGVRRPIVALEVEDPGDAARAAETGRLVAALPERFADLLAPGLRAIGPEPCAPLGVFAARRRNAGSARAADVVTEALREALR